MSVSAIIPAYNESERILRILKPLISHRLVSEIIVVDDGSIDMTRQTVKQFSPKIRLISYRQNKGKSYAVSQGLKASKNDIILTLDADLKGLKHKHIDLLVKPVIKDSCVVALAMCLNSFWMYKLINLDPITGVRCFNKKAVKPDVSKINSLSSFDIEIYLNKLILINGLSIYTYYFNDLLNTPKSIKFGTFNGVRNDIKMIIQISKYYKFNLLGFTQDLYLLLKRVKT